MNKQNRNVIDYDYIGSNHDYICPNILRKNHLHGLM